MNPERKKLVIFDFDGVLANTIEFCFQIHKNTNDNLTWEKFQSMAEYDFYDAMEKAEKDGSYKRPEDFYTSYEKKLSLLSLTDIIRSTVLKLKKSNIVSIISSTPSSHIIDFLKKENILELFDDILGYDVHASKTVKINSLLDKYELAPEDTVFVTDTSYDIHEANKCGIKVIGVTWGLHDRRILEKRKPVKIIDDPRDLLKVIEELI